MPMSQQRADALALDLYDQPGLRRRHWRTSARRLVRPLSPGRVIEGLHPAEQAGVAGTAGDAAAPMQPVPRAGPA